MLEWSLWYFVSIVVVCIGLVDVTMATAVVMPVDETEGTTAPVTKIYSYSTRAHVCVAKKNLPQSHPDSMYVATFNKTTNHKNSFM